MWKLGLGQGDTKVLYRYLNEKLSVCLMFLLKTGIKGKNSFLHGCSRIESDNDPEDL